VCVVAHHVLGAHHRRDGRLLVAVLDVGQGDSILVRSPVERRCSSTPAARRGRRGPQRGGAGTAVAGVRRLDAAVLTHTHPDHGGGLPAVMEELPVKELWKGWRRRQVLGRLLRGRDTRGRASRRGAAEVRAGQQLRAGDLMVDVLGPEPDALDRGIVRNDDSVVLRVAHGRHAFLLTADVEAVGESRAAARSGTCDVLKVAHHGSDTSTAEEFMAQVQPRLAVISVGRRNIWGLPRGQVLAGCAAGCLLRTDDDGPSSCVRRPPAGGHDPPARAARRPADPASSPARGGEVRQARVLRRYRLRRGRARITGHSRCVTGRAMLAEASR